MSEELDDLIARFGRWLRNTGFDGGVNSPPVKAHDALLRLRAENERLKAVVNAARVAAEELEYTEATLRAENELMREALGRIDAFDTIPPMDFLTTAERLECSVGEIKDIARNALAQVAK